MRSTIVDSDKNNNIIIIIIIIIIITIIPALHTTSHAWSAVPLHGRIHRVESPWSNPFGQIQMVKSVWSYLYLDDRLVIAVLPLSS